MIAGIGTDIIEIERIKQAVTQNPKFISRNFTIKEQDYFNTRKNSYETIAGNFAAKEAVSKALGTGFREFELTDIEITRNTLGAPIVSLYGRAKQIASEKNIKNILVSISHCKEYAVAYCVSEITT